MPETKIINGRLHVIGPNGKAQPVPLGMDEARTMKTEERELPFVNTLVDEEDQFDGIAK